MSAEDICRHLSIASLCPLCITATLRVLSLDEGHDTIPAPSPSSGRRRRVSPEQQIAAWLRGPEAYGVWAEGGLEAVAQHVGNGAASGGGGGS